LGEDGREDGFEVGGGGDAERGGGLGERRNRREEQRGEKDACLANLGESELRIYTVRN
jgi:hypothetical protein